MDVKEREFLQGHTLSGSQDTYFDKTKIEEMRAKYARMVFEPFVKVKKEERVISEDELQSYLQNGWHFEATLPSQRIVIAREVKVKQSQDTDVKDSAQKSDVQSLENPTSQKSNSQSSSAPNNNSEKTNTYSDENKTAIENSKQSIPRDTLQQRKCDLPVHNTEKHPASDKDVAKKKGHSIKNLYQSLLSDFSEKRQKPP